MPALVLVPMALFFLRPNLGWFELLLLFVPAYLTARRPSAGTLRFVVPELNLPKSCGPGLKCSSERILIKKPCRKLLEMHGIADRCGEF